jgi:hypothetical protein
MYIYWPAFVNFNRRPFVYPSQLELYPNLARNFDEQRKHTGMGSSCTRAEDRRY